MRACLRGFGVIVLLASVACSASSSDGAAQAEPTQAPPPPTTEAPRADPPPVAYPAFRPAPPQLASRGGKVLGSPKFQVIAYAGDPSASLVDGFVSSIGASAYWTDVVHEYGVGAATALPSVAIGDAAPDAIDDAQIATWLASEIDGGAVAAPDGQTVYVIAYPAGTTVTAGGVTACGSELGAYHAEAMLASGSVPYVVLPRCASFAGLSGDAALTYALSHELVEAVTDPLTASAPALEIDGDHLAWAALFGQEAGDLCEGRTATPAGFDFVVQRVWSNAAAAAGHQPCVPAPARPYFNAAPVIAETVTIDGVTLPAVKLAVGKTRTIDVQLFSDAATPAWKVDVVDAAVFHGKPAQLSLKLDRVAGANGDVLHLTMKALSRGRTGTLDGLSAFVVRSSSATDTSYWMAFVSN